MRSAKLFFSTVNIWIYGVTLLGSLMIFYGGSNQSNGEPSKLAILSINFGLAVVSSFVFYLVVVHLKSFREKRNLAKAVIERLYFIRRNFYKMSAAVETAAWGEYARRSSSAIHWASKLSSLSIASPSVPKFTPPFGYMAFSNWGDYMLSSLRLIDEEVRYAMALVSIYDAKCASNLANIRSVGVEEAIEFYRACGIDFSSELTPWYACESLGEELSDYEECINALAENIVYWEQYTKI